MKCLIADDSNFYRTILTQTLTGWGHEVLAATDGQMAWDMLRGANPPRIVILDWVMPKLTGLEVCQKIRSQLLENPPYVIILTVRDTKADLIVALQSGCDDFLTKPFDQDELRWRLQAGLRIVSLQDQLAQRVGTLEYALCQAQKLEWMGTLAGGVAHDFNNLLTVVRGYCDILRCPTLSQQDLLEAVACIQAASDRGTSLTRQLLTFARKYKVSPVEFNLNSCVANIQKMLNRLLGEDIQMVTRLSTKLHTIKADPNQVEQVLINLLVNSRDAMPRGGVITITTANVLIEAGCAHEHPGVPEGDYVVLSVRDTGHGMDPSTKARLFEPFFTTKEPGKGTGLGLATVYGIVRGCGGRIRVESEMGTGTTFWVYFPRVCVVASPTKVPEPACPAEARGETVLLVEDEDSVRRLLFTLLSTRGYRVLEASNGHEALRIGRTSTGPIHLMITDVVMPGMDGYETALRLKEIRPETKVLFMSGYSGFEILGRQNAPERVLQKPIASEQLYAAIHETLMS